MRYVAIALTCVVALSAGLLMSRWSTAPKGDDPATQSTAARGGVDAPMPALSLLDPQGNVHTEKQWDGQVVVVNFWATWCAPCLEEIPVFIELQNTYRERGVTFVGIALDDRDRVIEFMERLGMNYTVLLAGPGGITLGERFGNLVGALPFSALVNREGTIAQTHYGVLSRDDLERMLVKLL
ncbi:MAG: TlpA family protein disulfide reductase [Gammaproteobacteria bacterium]|nr:TlpA family protein disulfide reductase [Gammaproteobacteria bacterium]